MEIILVKTLSGFKPAHDSDYEKIKKLKSSEEYKCTVSVPRNLKFHKKYFALINLFFNNQNIYRDIDDLRHDLTILSGNCIEYVDFNGELRKRPKSISFSSMSQEDFEILYNKTLTIVSDLLKVDQGDILNEIENFY